MEALVEAMVDLGGKAVMARKEEWERLCRVLKSA